MLIWIDKAGAEMANSVNDDVFHGYITARKIYYMCRSEGVDMHHLLRHEYEHYRELKKNHKKSYQAGRVRINSYLKELSELILLDDEGKCNQ